MPGSRGRRNLKPSYADAWFPGMLASDLADCLHMRLAWLRLLQQGVTVPRARMKRT